MGKHGKEGDHDKEAQTAREAVPCSKFMISIFFINREAN